MSEEEKNSILFGISLEAVGLGAPQERGTPLVAARASRPNERKQPGVNSRSSSSLQNEC